MCVVPVLLVLLPLLACISPFGLIITPLAVYLWYRQKHPPVEAGAQDTEDVGEEEPALEEPNIPEERGWTRLRESVRAVFAESGMKSQGTGQSGSKGIGEK